MVGRTVALITSKRETAMKFHIENMTCGGCVRSVTKAIQSVDPDAKIKASPPERSVEIESSATHEQLESALREAGFPPRVS